MGFAGASVYQLMKNSFTGIPGKRVLRDGDIISIDIGAKLNGYHGDSAWTYPVGNISDDDKRLLEVTEESLYKGLKEAKPGERLSNISTQYKRMSKMSSFQLLGIMSDMVLVKTCMRIRKFLITVRQTKDLG